MRHVTIRPDHAGVLPRLVPVEGAEPQCIALWVPELDLAGLGADVVAVMPAESGTWAGSASVNGLPAGADDVVSVMLAFAEAFLDEGEAGGRAAGRVRDLPAGAAGLRAAVAAGFAPARRPAAFAAPAPAAGLVRAGDPASGAQARTAVRHARPAGVIGERAAVLLAPLGRLSAARLEWLARHVTGRPARITPWRSVVLPDQADAEAVLREAAGFGFGTDERSPWLRVTACAGQPGCARALADVQAALEASAGAFRFLAARVEALETAAARRRDPVDGMAWLVPPPDLGPWTDRVVQWMAGASGEVVVGECGDGALPRALAAAGLRVRAAEPRGTTAWSAAAGGVDVHLGPVAELVAARPSGGIGGLVLAGVVDRSPVEDLLDLLVTAADRLAPGSPLVVIGSAPAAWGPVALDLLPGRPLHPATWSLLLGRNGFRDMETAGGASPLTYAVRAVR